MDWHERNALIDMFVDIASDIEGYDRYDLAPCLFNYMKLRFNRMRDEGEIGGHRLSPVEALSIMHSVYYDRKCLKRITEGYEGGQRSDRRDVFTMCVMGCFDGVRSILEADL